ncbi:aspartate aminotransferase family protein [Streptomyces sp. NPDC006552]|uniref:aspartate aminotransferase family protein n=1 Tax=Streptomyces sp. NPDC006552 TaxID=3157179 RepID=UPI0033BC7DAF
MNQTSAKDIYYAVSDSRMERGKGIYLYDSDGNGYIDCASGSFNLSLGYSHPAVVEAIKEQADQLIHARSGFQHPLINTLASRLVGLAPKSITSAHLKVTGGSTANEGAIRMAQRATGRRDIITLFRSHVGQTMTMASLSGNAFRKASVPFPSDTGTQVPDPYCYRCFYGQQRESCGLMCVDRIDDFIEFASSGSVAAILVEPISANGGNIVSPEGYFGKLRDLCDQHGIKLILDELQTGIGRTGHMFAAEYFGVEPDGMTLGKGLGGSGAQVAAILASDGLSGLPADDHSFTFGANIMSAAAAVATLDVIDDPAFLANVRRTGALIMERMESLKSDFSCIGDVRGVGLMIGVEIIDADGRENAKLTNHLADKAMEFGLIIRTSRNGLGNVLKFRPPLIITADEATLMCDRFEALMRAHGM